MTDQVNTRGLALEFLLEVEKGALSHVALRGMLERYQYLDKQERAFLTRLCEGTLERRLELDAIINHFSKVPVKKQKPVIRNLLRMSVYQLKYMDQVQSQELLLLHVRSVRDVVRLQSHSSQCLVWFVTFRSARIVMEVVRS